MIENLFGSKTRAKLLHLFYNNPSRQFYVREMTRKIDEQINSVRRELANLLKIGIIRSENSNNRLYYEINQEYKHYDALKSLFTEEEISASTEATSSADNLTERIKDLGAVQLAILTGSFTRDETAGVDLLIVGDVNRTKVQKLVAELEEEEGRELIYSVLDPEDYQYRRSLNDRFLANALEARKTVIVDEGLLDMKVEEEVEPVAVE